MPAESRRPACGLPLISLVRKAVARRSTGDPPNGRTPRICRDTGPSHGDGVSLTGLAASVPRRPHHIQSRDFPPPPIYLFSPPKLAFKPIKQTTWDTSRSADDATSISHHHEPRHPRSSWDGPVTTKPASIKPLSSYFYWNEDAVSFPPLRTHKPALLGNSNDRKDKPKQRPRKPRKHYPWWSEFSMVPIHKSHAHDKHGLSEVYPSEHQDILDKPHDTNVMDFTKNTTTTSLPVIAKCLPTRGNISLSHYHADCFDPDDDFDISWTLPRIEAVLQSEGIHTGSIAHEIAKLNAKRKKQYDIERRQQIKSKPLRQHEPSPEYNLDVLVDDPEQCQAKKDFDDYSRDIDYIRWLSEQQIERGTINRQVSLPRVVVASSHVTGSNRLASTITDSAVLFVCYDYSRGNLSEILDAIRTTLDEYYEGYRMRSLMLYCQGGPGHIYLTKKKVLTTPKLLGDSHKDLVDFLKGVGAMMSKIDPDTAWVHILGCGQTEGGEELRAQLAETMSTVAYPSVAHFEMVDEMTDHGKEVLELYFNYEKYYEWKYEEFED